MKDLQLNEWLEWKSSNANGLKYIHASLLYTQYVYITGLPQAAFIFLTRLFRIYKLAAITQATLLPLPRK